MNPRSIRFQLIAWYSALLAVVVVLFAGITYAFVRHNLTRSLHETLVRRAKLIGDTILVDVGIRGEAYVGEEIAKRFEPEQAGRFIRIIRPDGGVLYRSGTPREEEFSPETIPVPNDANREFRDFPTRGGRLTVYLERYSTAQGTFTIEVGGTDRANAEILGNLFLSFGGALPLVVLAAAGGGYVLMRRALTPIHAITEQAERITLKNLNERMPVPATGDELERLSTALNRMIARIDESIAYVTRFTADASHELRTPLTILRGELETLVGHPLPAESAELAASALEETERLSQVVASLLEISRLDAGETVLVSVPVDLADLSLTIAGQMNLLAEDRHQLLTCRASNDPVWVAGDPVRLKQILVNLLDNAIKYTPDHGTIDLAVGRDDTRATIEVRDTGIGIAPDDVPHVFERFFRADKARNRQGGGAGLGLSIVKAICALHGAGITLESVEGQGSVIRLDFQVITPPTNQRSIPAAPPVVRSG